MSCRRPRPYDRRLDLVQCGVLAVQLLAVVVVVVGVVVNPQRVWDSVANLGRLPVGFGFGSRRLGSRFQNRYPRRCPLVVVVGYRGCCLPSNGSWI